MNCKKPVALLLVALLTGFLPGTGWAATIYVDLNNATGTEDGSQQFPYLTIQAGINAAATFDHVRVAAGVYNETIVVADGVSVFGAGPGLSIIDGNLRQNSVVTFDGTRYNPRFDGFTVRNGEGDFIGMLAGVPIHVGGGFNIQNSGPFITNNVIEDCVLDVGIGRGAGIYINNTGEIPSIIGNTIVNNTARSTLAPGASRGGGIFITSKVTSALVTENIIDMNVSDVGGGLYNKNLGTATLTIERNDFRFNEATDGAAIFTTSFSNSSTTIVNNLFVGNGSVAGIKDCDDASGSSTPGTGEICNDGLDNDCDAGTPDIVDADGDGAACDLDCDDSNPAINPSAGEHCADELDNDCDGDIDISNPDNVVLVKFGSSMTYRANTSDPGLAQTWVAPGFNDGTWTTGDYGIGYEDSPPGASNLFQTLVASGTRSVYTRTLFEVPDRLDVNALFLGADFDDGYAAWINGVEVFRSAQMPGTGSFTWNTAAANHESSNGVTPNYGALLNISTAGIPALVDGTNVLAVGVWNNSSTSDDLALVPWLSMSYGNDDSDCPCADNDGDNYACDDCNDVDLNTNPGVAEVCADSIDNDCNPATSDIVDADSDGYNCAIDCDDSSASVNPVMPEVHCDGINNDCNAGTPDVVDNDGDFANCTIDCNDASASVFPGQTEFCFDGMDNNCDGFIDAMDLECSCANPIDGDGDGYRCTDCNDGNAMINPGQVEVCNDGINNDCNSATPDVFDADGDGDDCVTDCQDFDPAVNATAIEICNDMIDNDCDTLTDEADPGCAGADADGDGYDVSVDCNDGNIAVNPGAAEICNDGINNDCNPGTPDLGDADMDGFNCTSDCDDGNPAIKPNAPEACTDLVDNDCDGLIDVVNPDLVLVAAGSSMKYRANQSDPGIGIAWRLTVFNDTNWNNGVFGIGYQFGTPGPGNSVEDLAVTTVPEDTVSVYTRTEFEISAAGSVNGVFLGADYDDGYVAYINGTEVYRSPEMPAGVPQWNADPALHESSNGQVPDYGTLIDISSVALPVLNDGTNLLAVGLYNDIPAGGGNSSDLILVPRLSINFGDDDPDCLCADLDDDGYSCTDCDDMDGSRSPGMAEIGCDGIDNDCNGGTSDLRDGDNDGYLCSVDCADNSPSVNPGAVELPCDFTNNDCNPSTSDVFDADLDGYTCQLDCDETDTGINPGQPEIGCDGIDNDCNTLTADVDDADFDTYRCDQDCDDADPLVYPGAFEKCDDGIDNDCDSAIDAADGVCACADGDADGYECEDCNDAAAAIHPAATETCNDGIDNDCDPATLDVGDADGDGWDCLADCDDTDPFIRPNAAEICNDAIDNDCNPVTPDIVDADMDTHACDVDCKDNDPMVHPGVVEQCNDTIDNDCNPSTVDIGDLDFDGTICTFDCNDQDDTIGPGETEICNDTIDNDCNAGTPDVFDADGDGASCNVDCNDADPARGQGIAEKCTDGIDNDCDSVTDNADADCSCPDADGDGYKCADCNDAVAATNPGAPEICNDGIDNDCKPATLDVGDYDNDGFLCTQDCDDNDPLAYPSGIELCNDGNDNDCNPGTPDIADLDGDTYNCIADCDDDNALVHPGAVEVGCDALDNDCNPATSDLSDVDGDGFTCVDGKVRGGALTALAKASTAKVSIVNNTFYNNAVPSGIGGAVYLDDMSAAQGSLVANNVFMSNQAELGGGLVHTFFYGNLKNNDFFVNLPADLYDAGGSGMTPTANLFTDPRLSSAATGNYRLHRSSPLIDAADPTVAPTNDLDRVARPYDGDFDLTALPDMGAYEWPSGEVLDLVFEGHDAISWRVEHPGDVYNVYRGSLATLKSTGSYTQPTFPLIPETFCNVPASSLPFGDGFDPPTAGQVAFYLVTFRGVSFEGTLGPDSSGVLRQNTRPCP